MINIFADQVSIVAISGRLDKHSGAVAVLRCRKGDVWGKLIANSRTFGVIGTDGIIRPLTNPSSPYLADMLVLQVMLPPTETDEFVSWATVIDEQARPDVVKHPPLTPAQSAWLDQQLAIRPPRVLAVQEEHNGSQEDEGARPNWAHVRDPKDHHHET